MLSTKIGLAVGLGLALCACSPQEAPPRLPLSGWAIEAPLDLNSFFDCLAADGAAAIVAHRGGPQRGYPENALETFARTLQKSPALIETDVSASKDGVLFLLHDDTLERTTSGQGDPASVAWKDIAKLRLVDDQGVATAFRPARLDEALKWAGGKTILKIDIKRGASFEAVADQVKKAGAEARVILIAYTLAQAQKLHFLLPNSMISLNLGSMSELNSAVAQGLPADRLIGFTGTDEPDPRLFQMLEQRAVEADFGTLGRRGIDQEIARSGEEVRYAQIAAEGADILSTDRPAEVFAALAKAGRAPKAGRCGVTKS